MMIGSGGDWGEGGKGGLVLVWLGDFVALILRGRGTWLDGTCLVGLALWGLLGEGAWPRCDVM